MLVRAFKSALVMNRSAVRIRLSAPRRGTRRFYEASAEQRLLFCAASAPFSRVTNFFAYHKSRMRLLLIAANLFLLPKNASVFGSPYALRWRFPGALNTYAVRRAKNSFFAVRAGHDGTGSGDHIKAVFSSQLYYSYFNNTF